MTPLRLIDTIRIAAPCPASWDSMSGDDRTRHCALCNRAVYNLAGMTEGEAIALIRKHQGEFCGRVHRRKDGTILDGDCPVGVRDRGRRRARRFAVGAFVAGVLAFSGSLFAGRARPSWNRIPPIPSGPNITLRDWSDWALYAIGAKRQPQFIVGKIAMPMPPGGWDCPPGMEAGDAPEGGEMVSADAY